MDKIGKLSQTTFELFGQVITINHNMVIMTYVVIAFLVVISFISTRKLRLIPRPLQNMVEVIFDFIEDVTVGTLGNKDGKKFVPLIFSIFVFAVSLILFFMPEKFGYITKRLLSFFDPGKGDQFQSTSALDAIKLGGLKGRGMGEGVLKDSVPEAHTDYIISIISEEYGSILSSIIIFIFLYIAFRIIKNCINQEDQLIKFSLCGLASLLIFQTFIHVGVNTSLIPTTGMTLPFLSYGGSSLIGSAILAGIILNYTKDKNYLYD